MDNTELNILKFGGTSVGTADRMKQVIDIITRSKGRKIVVLSAMAGTTNKLKQIAACIESRNAKSATNLISHLRLEYVEVVNGLFSSKAGLEKGFEIIDKHFELLTEQAAREFDEQVERIVSAQGELISTALFNLLCTENGVASSLLPALDFMKLDQDKRPDYHRITTNLLPLMYSISDEQIYITQGYICRNANGEVDNLGRGGSDYTATIIGSVLRANEVQIWADIDGLHNNDPRYVGQTSSVPAVSYEEASTLAYYGAKILHPACVTPVQKNLIPLRLKNTFEPEANGTLVGQQRRSQIDKIASLKENVGLISIQSNNKYPIQHFLIKVFEAFSLNGAEVDMFSIANQSVTIVFESKYKTNDLMWRLNDLGEITYETDYAIVNLVGRFEKYSSRELSRIFGAISNIPIRMVSQKSDKYSYLLLLTKSKYRINVLNQLNDKLINRKKPRRVRQRI